MKKKIRRRRCKNCDDLFKPDPRNLKRQKFCRKLKCKEASKRYSQQKWERILRDFIHATKLIDYIDQAQIYL